MTEKNYPELDETVFRETLGCGLPLAVVPRQGFSKKLCYLAVDFGSVHTDFTLEGKEYHVPAGTAHYLEHKLFDMPGGRDVSAEFAALGASVNAFTSYDMTAYYFSCTENFTQCLRLLTEFVFTPYFTPESVEKERGIIDQEIGMNLDSPDSVIFDRLMETMYREHPIRIPILGTRESIREITPQVLETCHRAFYTPVNCCMCIVGDVDPGEAAETVRQVLGDAPRPAGKKLPLPEEAMRCPASRTHCTMDIAMPTFCLGFKCAPVGLGEKAIRQEMAADLAAEALFGESSELYLQLYQEGLIDSSFGGGFDCADGCAMLLCSGDSENAEEVREAVLRQARALIKQGIPEDYFLRMKRSALGRRIKALDSFDSTCFRLCTYHFAHFDYFLFPAVYRDIQEAEVLDFLARAVTPDRCALSVIDPSPAEEA